jgi:hypothetical protein
MPDSQDLHQIEYRHHQRRDLYPIASSMSSAESLQGWHSRIDAWVRHPHNDRLSESVCYQVFPNGQAALAWRLWDQRAAERSDGTRGRPLVSRVLVGQESVLTGHVAIALCRSGLPAALIGPAPGDVPDGARLPAVSGDALHALVRDMAPGLDQDAGQQQGLQAMTAAGLADPSIPLAVTLRDNHIQRPVREGVQAPLLWGLIRIAGPLLGRVGRGWSFSTYELPLGETDPASLPAIVFRQAQEGPPSAPSRHRKELKVRPYDATALLPGTPYADRVEVAGWLVDEYREHGGAGLRKFIEGCAGTESSFQMRMERVEEELAKRHPPVGPPEATGLGSLSPLRTAGPAARDEAERLAEPVPAEPVPAKPSLAEPLGLEDAEGSATPVTPASPVAAVETAGAARPASPAAPAAAGARPAPSAEPMTVRMKTVSPQDLEGAAPYGAPIDTRADSEFADTGSWGQGRPPEPEQRQPDIQPPPPAWTNDRAMSLGTTREGRAPQLPTTGRSEPQHGPYGEPAIPSTAGQPADPAARNMGQQNRGRVTVSNLLTQLGMAGHDRGKAENCLRAISLFDGLDDPDERRASWRIISDVGWCESVCSNAFHPDQLAAIFRVAVIPDLREQGAAEKVGRWALKVPPTMIGALLSAARMSGPDTWQAVMGLLEPFLALRLVSETYIKDQWDTDRASRLAAEFGQGDSKGGLRSRLRRR